MSEALQAVQETAPEVQTEQQEPQQQQTDSYEELAKAQGWRPKEEFEGDPDKWRPAREFVERGELFGKIDSMGKELKETRKALKMLQDHHAKVKETEYNKALTELKALQAEQKAREVTAQMAPQQPDPRFITWANENKWYNSDQEMRQFADAIGVGYAQSNPGLDPVEVLNYVTAQVKSRFKDKFVNPNRSKPNSVEGATTAAANKSSFELTEDERKVMNTFVRQGLMSKEEYIAEVKRMRG